MQQLQNKFTVLFLFLSSVCFGQLGPAQSALIYKATSANRAPLVFEDNTTTYSVRSQNISTVAVAPRLLWDNGKTHFVYQDPGTGSGRAFILTYDERYGIGRPIGFGTSVNLDGHHRPAIIRYSDTLFIAHETNHNVAPIRLYKGKVNDAMIFDRQANTIGVTPTYLGLHIKNGVFSILNQFNDTRGGYLKNSSGVYGGTWTTEDDVGLKQANEDELYTWVPNNSDQLPNELIWTLLGNNDDTSPQTAFNRYVVRAEVTTASEATFYNWSKSFSTVGTISQANMSQYLYHTTGSDIINAYVPIPAVDILGNYYDVAGDGSGGYRFLYLFAGQSVTTDKAITLPSSPTLIERTANQGACMSILAVNQSEIYTFWSVDDGSGNDRVYCYKTTNLGDTWVFVDDVFDDVAADINHVTIPYNSAQIPENRNFIVIGVGTGDPVAPIYMKRAAFGEVQTNDTQNHYDNYTAYTASEYDALMLRSYYVEAGKVTNTGTTLNTVIDQSPSAQDGTTVGSPVMDDATTPTFVSFDGSNDRIVVPTTGLLALEQGTVIMVVKNTLNTTQYFTTFTKNDAADPRIFLGAMSSNLTRWNDTNGTCDGSTVMSDAFHIIAWTFQNGRSAVLHFLDGELQFRTETNPHVAEGAFTLDKATLDRISIGFADRATNSFYDFDFKHFAMTGTPMTTEQISRAFKYLANKYSITLVDHYSN